MRLLALLVAALLGVYATACGGASKREGSASDVASKATAAHGAGTTPTGAFLNDGDNDDVGDADGDNNADTDNDVQLDYKPNENGNYHDADDKGFFTYGHAASAAQERAVAAVVERYFAAAATSNGTRACAQLTRRLAKAIPIDYGQRGPSYLRPGKTCAAVIALLFENSHTQLAAPPAVTSVRVEGNLALALVGSRAMPAGYMIVQREGGAWKIAQVLSGRLV
jgi:hypothetical protein